MNCIHWVESHELPVLEFLSHPQPKEGHGIFGGGWERPRNVFAAAKNFAKRLEREEQEIERDQSSSSRSPNGKNEPKYLSLYLFLQMSFRNIQSSICLNFVAGDANCEAETEAQAKARRRAGEELRWKPLFDAWNGLIGWRKPAES